MRRHCRFGFTLLELSIVLVVLSLMMGGILAVLTQDSRISKKAELQMKMDAIEQAIIAYTKRSSTYALPCPADPDLAITHANFGVAVASGCASLLYEDGDSAAGAVPVKTIGLPDEYAIDPWGNQFTYDVGLLAATTNALVTYPITSASLGVIIVRDFDDNPISSVAVMVLVSHGPNKFGAFGSNGIRRDVDSNNPAEQSNCNCESNGAYDTHDSSYTTGINTQDAGDEENSFDDIVRYYERSFFRLSGDLIL